MNDSWRNCWRCGVPWHSSEIPVMRFESMVARAIKDLGTDATNLTRSFVCPSCVHRPQSEIPGPIGALIMTVERGHKSRVHMHWQPNETSCTLRDEQSLSYGCGKQEGSKKRRILLRNLMDDLSALVAMRCIPKERSLEDLPADALPFRDHPVTWVPVIFRRRWLDIVNRLRRIAYRHAGLTMKQCPKFLRRLDERTWPFSDSGLFRHESGTLRTGTPCLHCGAKTWITRSISFNSRQSSILCTRMCTECDRQCGRSWAGPLPEPVSNHCLWSNEHLENETGE